MGVVFYSAHGDKRAEGSHLMGVDHSVLVVRIGHLAVTFRRNKL